MIAEGKLMRTPDKAARISWANGAPIARNHEETIHSAVIRQIPPTQNSTIKRSNLIIAHYPDQGDPEASYDEDPKEGYVFHTRKVMPIIRRNSLAWPERRRARFDGVFPPGRPTRIGPPGNKDQLNFSSPPSEPNVTIPNGRVQQSRPEAQIPKPALPFDPMDSDQVMEDVTAPQVKAPPHQQKQVPSAMTKQKKKPAEGPKMQSAVGRQLNMDKLVTNVLSTPLTLTLSELLGDSPQCPKQVSEYLRITRPKTYATEHEPAKVYRLKNLGKPGFDDRLIQLQVKFANGLTADAVVDPGSQMDVLSKDLCTALQLPIDPLAQASMEDAGLGRTDMYGLCHDVELTTGNLKSTTDLWVGPSGVPLLLGRPWQRKNRISIEERASGTWLSRRNDLGIKTWEICALPIKRLVDLTNTSNHFFGQSDPQPAYHVRKHPKYSSTGDTQDNPIHIQPQPGEAHDEPIYIEDDDYYAYDTEPGEWIDEED